MTTPNSIPSLSIFQRASVPSALAIAALLACNLLLLMPAPDALQAWAALGMTAILPGLLLANTFLGRDLGPGERFVFGIGAGYGLLILILLAMSYLPGGLSFAPVAAVFNALTLLLALWAGAQVRRSALHSPARLMRTFTWKSAPWEWIALLALLIGAGYLRFTHLGYSELHGDEALVALRAVDVIQGWERGLFVHKKGPGEILIGAAIYLLTGKLTEFGAHLPFALASWTGVLATYLLGRRWFGPITGLWAGAMVAVDGYLMAFGRMLQYQSVVFLLVVLTVLAAQRALDAYRTGDAAQRGRTSSRTVGRYLLLAAFLLAVGLLTHYEAIAAALPAGWLLIALWRREGNWRAKTRSLARLMALPLGVGAAILAFFYVPYIRDPEFFRDTYAYIFGHRLAGRTQPEGLAVIVGRSTLYSGSYYVWTLIALLVVGLVQVYRRTLPTRLLWLWAALLIALMVWLLIDPVDVLALPGRLALVWFAALFAPTWLSPRIDDGERAAWLWLGVLLLGVIFFVMKPGTHVYVFFIPWALVSGRVVGRLWQAAQRRFGARAMQMALAPALILLALIFGNYVRKLFVVNEVEVLRTWDENRPAGYWTPFDSPTFESIFGFPIRNGWKTVAALYDQGILSGRFDTNDRFSMVPDWYLRGEEYCARDEPNYYLLVPYPLPVDRPLVDEKRGQLTDNHYLWGTVTANEQPHMEIYARKDRAAEGIIGAPRTLREEEYTDYFNTHLLEPFTRNGPLGAQPIPNPTSYRYGDAIHLLGYSVDHTQVEPGGELEVALYWSATAPLPTNYFVSLQVIDPADGRKAGQRDGEPGCNRFPTTGWVPGDRIYDRYHIPIAPDAQPGEYTLYVIMYSPESGPLTVTDAAGQQSGGAALGTITVRE